MKFIRLERYFEPCEIKSPNKLKVKHGIFAEPSKLLTLSLGNIARSQRCIFDIAINSDSTRTLGSEAQLADFFF